jgi:hypothetical protein
VLGNQLRNWNRRVYGKTGYQHREWSGAVTTVVVATLVPLLPSPATQRPLPPFLSILSCSLARFLLLFFIFCFFFFSSFCVSYGILL